MAKIHKNIPAQNILFWVSRILAIAFALFLSLFALDVFGTGPTIWHEIIGFLIHLLPVYLILGALFISCRHPKYGGWFFVVLGVFFLALESFRFDRMITFLLAGPLFVIGLLFLIGHRCNNKKYLH